MLSEVTYHLQSLKFINCQLQIKKQIKELWTQKRTSGRVSNWCAPLDFPISRTLWSKQGAQSSSLPPERASDWWKQRDSGLRSSPKKHPGFLWRPDKNLCWFSEGIAGSPYLSGVAQREEVLSEKASGEPSAALQRSNALATPPSSSAEWDAHLDDELHWEGMGTMREKPGRPPWDFIRNVEATQLRV